MGAAILGAVLCAAQSTSYAQSLTAGNVPATAGTTAMVPITLSLPTGQTAATMQFNLTAVPGTNSPPAINTQVTFVSNVGPPSQNAANGINSRLVGWFSNFDPLLTGDTIMGVFSVPIPADAPNSTYTVQVINPSGTSDVDNSIDLIPTAVNGTITVEGGVPVATATNTVPPPTATATKPPATATHTPVPPTATATKPPATATATKPPATATATATTAAGIGGSDDDGCQIATRGAGSNGWLLLIPAAALVLIRRRYR